MSDFAAYLATLADCSHISHLTLHDDRGNAIAILHNRPGEAGSLRLYHALWLEYGVIDQRAATAGLSGYHEHLADAELNPGRHPNIDRLRQIAAGAPALAVVVHARRAE
jgi:hypothetical protein